MPPVLRSLSTPSANRSARTPTGTPTKRAGSCHWTRPSPGSEAREERARPARGWESLTPTELRVAGLVAEGLTNPEIGERMFISRGTVKVHLSHIFAKLGIGTRSELAAEATRRDLAS
jgi:DNA-binding CsgD family transcriptional regulator